MSEKVTWAIAENMLVKHKRRVSVARVSYRSANGDVGYRKLGTKRVVHCSEDTFRRNWEPLQPEVQTNE